MVSLEIHASPSDAKRFQASGTATNGSNWDLSGDYKVEGDNSSVMYAFAITYKARFATENFRGKLLSNGTMLWGTFAWGTNPVTFPNNFVFKRLSAEAMKFWPSPREYTANKSRALWQFACNAVRADVARKLHSWAWIQQRWNNGKEYVRLRHKMDMGPLTAEEERALSECYRRNTPEEARLYQIFLDLRRRSVPDHL